jgi:predicted DNA-binding transcriptional regulator AlpA
MKFLINIEETAKTVSLSQSSIKRMVADKNFPEPIHLGSRVLWRVSDIEEWVGKLKAGEVKKKEKRGRPRLAV